MYKLENGTVHYEPLYIHRFCLHTPRKFSDAQRFYQQHPNYQDIDNIPDRLRWCRYRLGLMQEDVANRIGITRAQYLRYEAGTINYYPPEIIEKLSELYQDLLDDYNRFLYAGQGKQIQACRTALGLNKKEFAQLLHWELRSDIIFKCLTVNEKTAVRHCEHVLSLRN